MAEEADALRAFRETERRFAQECGLELRERTLDIDGPVRKARVIEHGEGSPLLFVHGGGSFASAWLPLLSHVGSYRSIAVDRPGCGLTDACTYERSVDLRAHATTFLTGVLDALELPSVDIVANSMGGLWSLWLALDTPGRVRSLTLVGCPALVVGTSAPVPMRVLSRRGVGRLMEQPATSAGFGRVMKMLGHDPAELSQSFIELSVAAGNLPGTASSFRSLVHRALRLRGGRPDCSLDDGALRALAANPLIIWGKRDPFGSLGAARMFAEATSGELEVIGRGHLPWLDEPERVASLIEAQLREAARA